MKWQTRKSDRERLLPCALSLASNETRFYAQSGPLIRILPSTAGHAILAESPDDQETLPLKFAICPRAPRQDLSLLPAPSSVTLPGFPGNDGDYCATRGRRQLSRPVSSPNPTNQKTVGSQTLLASAHPTPRTNPTDQWPPNTPIILPGHPRRHLRCQVTFKPRRWREALRAKPGPCRRSAYLSTHVLMLHTVIVCFGSAPLPLLQPGSLERRTRRLIDGAGA
ncbi:hypothetical protein KC361_g186 [Hortaea werneckii]|nr:hypothetical protein KC361_g186 [Hortaea werneckii]